MTDDIMWVEKYRPTEFDDVMGQDGIAERMEGFVDDPAMPNLLLSGPQGTGKTTLVHLLARHKYGDGWHNKLLELNASDSRGINVIRENVKSFAETGVAGADFGLVFLDEADQLTSDAQPALRRIMEDYDDTTRFILSCNYQNQLIDPIKSRCGLMQFTPLNDEEIRMVLERVEKGEDLDVEFDAREAIVRVANGDARHAIHTLQVSMPPDSDELTEDDVDETVGVVPKSAIEEVFELAIDGDFEKASKHYVVNVQSEGVPIDAAVEEFQWQIRRSELSGEVKMRAMDALGELDWRLRQGANPQVQVNRFLSLLPAARWAE